MSERMDDPFEKKRIANALGDYIKWHAFFVVTFLCLGTGWVVPIGCLSLTIFLAREVRYLNLIRLSKNAIEK